MQVKFLCSVQLDPKSQEPTLVRRNFASLNLLHITRYPQKCEAICLYLN